MDAIRYTSEKSFSTAQVEKLFLSVGWVSGRHPQRLHRALMGSSLVLTAWDGDRLVGLVRTLDDGELTAYVHYVLVDPAYHGCGIAGYMIERLKEHYRDYLRIEVMPEKSKTPLSASDSASWSGRTARRCRQLTPAYAARLLSRHQQR